MGIRDKLKGILTRGKDRKPKVGVEMVKKRTLIYSEQPRPVGEPEIEKKVEEEEPEEEGAEEFEEPDEEDFDEVPVDLEGKPEEERLAHTEDMTEEQKELYRGFRYDRLQREKNAFKDDNVTKDMVWGYLDDGTPISNEQIAKEIGTEPKIVAYYRSLKTKEDRFLGKLDTDIAHPPNIHSQPQQPQEQLPQQPRSPPASQQQPNYQPQQNYQQPPPRDPMLQTLFDLQIQRGQQSEERMWGIVQSLIEKGNKGDGFLDGVVGDTIKSKIVSQAIGGTGGGSDLMQALTMLISSGQLTQLGGQLTGLFHDIVNKDNPNINPFEEVEEGGTDMEVSQEQFVKEFHARWPNVPLDIIEPAVGLAYKEQPGAAPQVKYNTVARIIKGLDDFKEGMLAFKTFVVRGSKTPAEAAAWVQQSFPDIAKTMRERDLNEMLQRARPFGNNRSVRYYLNYLESPKVRPVVEEFLKYLKNPELLKKQPSGQPTFTTPRKNDNIAEFDPELTDTERASKQAEQEVEQTQNKIRKEAEEGEGGGG